MKKLLLSQVILFFVVASYGQQKLPYKDASLPVEARVKDLLGRMTPEEKFWQLFMIPGDIEAGKEAAYTNGIFGFQVSAQGNTSDAAGQLLSYSSKDGGIQLARKINAIQKYFIERSRLGIPIIAFDEALHGLVRDGATSFPQAIALAATFDTALMAKVAGAIAEETRLRGIRQILTPVVNIASDVRWGRTEETYGEDPFLSSEMGVAFVKQFEQKNIITTPKHFLANSGDGGRDSYPIHYNDRLMEEIYLPPFRACIERGGSRSIMTAYNSIDGSPSSANNWLLNKKLKEEWKFKGFVISDASAVGGANVLHYTASDYPEASQQSITNGLDVIFQTSYDHYKLFIPPFLNGAIDQKRIDDAVSRVLRAKFELGLFEQPYIAEDSLQFTRIVSRHKEIAREAAIKSMVLLKNDGKTLPLKSLQSIAIIGSDAMEARLGGYSGPGNGKVSILEGIKARAGKSIKISYSPGVARSPLSWTIIPTSVLSPAEGAKTTGLKMELFNNISLKGKPLITRVEKQLNASWTLYSPDPSLALDHYSVRWTGVLKPTVSGKYKIGLDGNDGFRLYVNDKLLIDRWKKVSYTTELVDLIFEKNKEYKIRVEFFESAGNARCKLIWNVGVKDEDQSIAEAVKVGSAADLVLVVAGIHEGEFQDRAMLNLPGRQEELIRKLAQTGRKVVVVLIGGSAITMSDWLGDADAVLHAWYPGEEGGHAVASVLFGDHNPAGRLPITFPIHEAQLPLVYNHKPTGRGDDYHNLSGLPLFPFGYGLGYTQFSYDSIWLQKNSIGNNDSTDVNVRITNRGDMAGEEVVQLYVRDLLSSVARPVLELKGFQRVRVEPGKSTVLSFKITPEMLRMLDKDLNWIVEPGDFRIQVGGSSRDLQLKTNLTVVAQK